MLRPSRTILPDDVLRYTGQALDRFFAPRNVAVIGATETAGSVGRTVLWNLVSSPFGGTVFPVNPRRPNVLGIKAWPAIHEVPAAVDLAVIVTPAPTVPGVIRECVEVGVPAAIVISAGFKERGTEGAALEAEVLREARRGGLRIIGPNCLGVMNPIGGLNATFAAAIARPGRIAFVSQSGALLTAILDWSLREQVGFSAFVSTGSMLDVGWGDLIDYLGDDPRTEAILIYMESVGDARQFLSAAREVALAKPIIVIKAGRSEAAARAAASHTGALTGSDEVLDAAFRRVGVLRVSTIGDLFYMAEVLGKQPRPAGPRLTILTNAGGPAVLATDALVAGGGEIAPLSDETLARLDDVLPPAWSHNDPIDVLGDAPPERYARAVEIAAADPHSDGLLVVLTPQDMTDPTATAEALRPYTRLDGKPVLASWMGGLLVRPGEDILNQAGIPTFAYPDTAAQAFCYMWRYTDGLRALYETPVAAEAGAHAETASRIVTGAREAGRVLLDEHESKAVLAAYGIPAVETRLATTEEEAASAADQLGYPVVVKLHSRTVTHKTDVGGVRLGLADRDAVIGAVRGIREAVGRAVGEQHMLGVTVQPMIRLRDAYELILGSSVDAQLGPVLLFGTGGQLVEVFRDRSLGLPPLTTTLARRMIERTRIARALRGVRGRAAVDLERLEQILVRFGQLVVEQPWISEIDINPLLAGPGGIVALDARVVLHPPGTRPEDLPRPAIRPYPGQYAGRWQMSDGEEVLIRPIRPEDEPAMVEFHRTLSDRSVRLRYAGVPLDLAARIAHERLVRVCFNDYDRDLALVVERQDGAAGEILAIGRLRKTASPTTGEFAILVSDRWQNRGLGTELLRRLLNIARAEGLTHLESGVLPENTRMLRICERLGFQIERSADRPSIEVTIDL